MGGYLITYIDGTCSINGKGFQKNIAFENTAGLDLQKTQDYELFQKILTGLPYISVGEPVENNPDMYNARKIISFKPVEQKKQNLQFSDGHPSNKNGDCWGCGQYRGPLLGNTVYALTVYDTLQFRKSFTELHLYQIHYNLIVSLYG